LLQLWEPRTNRGQFQNLWGSLEGKDLALTPIKQRIVAVEPGVSKHKRNGGVQLSNKECHHEDITSRVMDSQIHGMGNPRSEGSIEESELNRMNTIRGQIEFIHKAGIYKTMGGATIYESGRRK